MYGKEKMLERLNIHQQIYDNEKGLYKNQPLYKVTYGNTHIAYSKGAIVMVKLSELIGEGKVNLALKNFLLDNKYPKKPTSLDLLNEFYKVAPNENVKSKIDSLYNSGTGSILNQQGIIHIKVTRKANQILQFRRNGITIPAFAQYH